MSDGSHVPAPAAQLPPDHSEERVGRATDEDWKWANFTLAGGAVLISLISLGQSCDASKHARSVARASVGIVSASVLAPATEGKGLEIEVTLKNYGQSVAENIWFRFERWDDFISSYPNVANATVRLGPGEGVIARGRMPTTWTEADTAESTQFFRIGVCYQDSSSGEFLAFTRDLRSEVDLTDPRDGHPYKVELQPPVAVVAGDLSKGGGVFRLDGCPYRR